MDELEISGKRYISSRLAAKEHKYHADYIGQLVRAGKVEAQKVGRAWYVNAESLATYLGKEAPPRGPLPSPKQVPASIVQSEPLVVAEKISQVETTPVEPEVLKTEEIKITEVTDPEERKIDILKISRSEEYSGGLKYIRDDSPLFPHVGKNSSYIAPPTIDRVMLMDVEQDEEEVESVATKPNPHAPPTRMITKTLAMVVLGVVILLGTMLLSSRIVSTTSIEEGQPASVYYGLQ